MDARRGLIVLAGPVLALVLGGTVRADATVPWSDSDAQGQITLYDSAGHVLTGGLVSTHPFAARAVGSRPAPAALRGAGRNTTLYAYQPRQGVEPGLWSGDMMTGTTPYADPAHPTVKATASDFSLKDFISEYPPKWDGLLQLRILTGAAGQSTPTAPYAALTIEVTGDRWQVVGATAPPSASAAAPSATPGTTGSAGSGASSSSTARGSSAHDKATRTSASGSAAGSGSGPGTVSSSVSPAEPTSRGSTSSSGSPSALVALLGVLGLAVGLGLVWRLWRARG